MGLFGFGKKREKTGKGGSQRGQLDQPADLVVPMIAGTAWMQANEQMFGQIPDFPEQRGRSPSRSPTDSGRRMPSIRAAPGR